MTNITEIAIILASVGGTIILAYCLTVLLPKKSYLPYMLTGKNNFHKLLILVIIVALFDFYFVSLIPVLARISDSIIQYLIVGIFLISAVIIIFITIEIRNIVLNLKISLIARNIRFLRYSLLLILAQEIVITLFYLTAILNLILGIDTLPGVAFIFDVKDSEIADLDDITHSIKLIPVLLLTGIKGAFLFLHHGAILLVFITLYVILEEWNNRTHETPIDYFLIFTLGYVIQGVGQIIQSLGVFSTALILAPDEDIPGFLAIPIVLGGLIVLIGAIIYYFSFTLAAMSLLNNISHLLLPKWAHNVSKVIVVIFPVLYGILYLMLAILNLVWIIIGGSTIEDLASALEWITHLIDIPAMILMPLCCGLFFLIAFRQSRSKKRGQELGSYVLWTFLSLFLVFGSGNNTMSAVSWFGMIHGPLSLLGAIVLLYGLSRVADHASRHRRVIQHIRENPDEFMFLAKLGEAERKIQVWAKVDSLVKTGIIKPLVPTESPPDETQAVAEINSYMAEITKMQKRVRKRRPLPVKST
ncbi:MAG: hypothetical protein ACFFCQ_08370 [Promethearchaeota archaeon]